MAGFKLEALKAEKPAIAIPQAPGSRYTVCKEGTQGETRAGGYALPARVSVTTWS